MKKITTVSSNSKSNKNQQEILRSELVQEFALDVTVGLSSQSKFLPSKYFYDKNGSELFEQICALPEYYPTRTEAATLQFNSSKIAKIVNPVGNDSSSTNQGISVIELGSGSSTKTRILLNQFQALTKRICYFPIDISHNMLQETTTLLKSQFPSIDVRGIPMGYESGIEEVNKIIDENPQTVPDRKIVVFLGSSIGNFEPEQSISFLRMLRSKLKSGRDMLLIGFDLHKNPKILNAAYNDKQGITAKFNLNLLERINRELGGNFDVNRFIHRAFYNNQLHRIEMHLVSTVEQEVYIASIDKSFSFRKGETIHTENSYKYSISQIKQMALQSGLTVNATFTDRRKWFALTLFGCAC